MTARTRPGEPSLGPLPVGGTVLVGVGLALALGLLALDPGLLPLAGVLASAALVAGLVRVRGELVGTWAALALRHRLRRRELAPAPPDEGLGLPALDAGLGPLTVVDGRDHDGRPLALLGDEHGAWSAVLAPDVEELPLLLDPPDAGGRGADWVGAGVGGFPLPALADTLHDRGVVLDAVTVVRHVRPGADDGPARDAHREVLGPLADAAHRSSWLVVRLDPDRCPGAVAERGGGVLGARRALVGALARIGRVLADAGVPVRPLERDGLREAVALAAGVDLDRTPGGTQERWDAVVVGEVGHATWVATALGPDAAPLDLDALVAGDAVGTVALALVADDGPDEVGADLHVRVTARTPEAITEAGRRLVAGARGRGLRLEPLHGRHGAGLRATLPLGARP
ncbi:type VII secretion protein EccE [Actinomycetospora atypica]|uniref:Type VII secretion protein EccE n=1 Tax=Actinomycetospora atypica TaxID=1290095 RepID=A0ABV9YS33_9PSEU